MTTLTYGERFIRCLIGEEVDRVPFPNILGWSAWWESEERWRRESGNPALDYRQVVGLEPSCVTPSSTVAAGIFPLYEKIIISEDEDYTIWRDEKGITKRDRRRGGSMPEFLDYPVKSPEDWERLKVERLNPHTPGRITQDWDEFRAYLAKTGEALQAGWFPFGIFGTPRDLLGVEELLVSFYTEPEMIHDMMQHLTTLWLSVWEQVAAEVQIDHIHIWEDMSGKQGSLISPAMVEEFMMPCYDRIVDFAHAHNVRLISVDSDGDCSELVPVMMRHGINMFFPFEVQAGNDVRDYRQQYPTLGIIGGLDKRALAGSRADVDVEIARAADMLQHGRYIPTFDHSIPPDASWENFRYAVEEIKTLCMEESHYDKPAPPIVPAPPSPPTPLPGGEGLSGIENGSGL